ncbi:hypothetical protein HK096_006101, partial [Nowakowskiella sp. JEL0078]
MSIYHIIPSSSLNSISDFDAENEILPPNFDPSSSKLEDELLSSQSSTSIFDSFLSSDAYVINEGSSSGTTSFDDISPLVSGLNSDLPIDLPDLAHNGLRPFKLFDDFLSSYKETATIPCSPYQSPYSPVQQFSPGSPVTPLCSPLSSQSPPGSPASPFYSPLSVHQYLGSPDSQNFDQSIEQDSDISLDHISTKSFSIQLGILGDYQSVNFENQHCFSQTGINQNEINSKEYYSLPDSIKSISKVSDEMIAILSNDSMRQYLLSMVQIPDALNLLSTVATSVAQQLNEKETPVESQSISPLAMSLPNLQINSPSDQIPVQPILKPNRKSPKAFQCPQCSRIFTRRFNLQTHIETHQSNRVREHVCDGCQKSFVRIHDLQRHKRIHTNPDMFTCPANCGKSFSRKDALNRHLAVK